MLLPVLTADFAYDLPSELIAQEPAEPRDAARLMVVRRSSASIEHRTFRDLPELLTPGDLLVVNDTRVMAARLEGERVDTGGRVETLLVRPLGGRQWETLFRPARRALPGRTFTFRSQAGPLVGTVVRRTDELVILEFNRDVDPALVGSVPLPPYITAYHGDPERYQTIFSREARSAAAPTAGLHFTDDLLLRLERRGLALANITLEVGPGTFRPVTADDPREHHLHREHFSVPESAASAIRATRERGGRVVAVGTTVVRTLEHVARERGTIAACEGDTELFILPGDRFLATDGLVTNFHLPRSTLLMLVCAFGGRDLILSAYAEAIRQRYRFFSFGDAMLVL